MALLLRIADGVIRIREQLELFLPIVKEITSLVNNNIPYK